MPTTTTTQLHPFIMQSYTTRNSNSDDDDSTTTPLHDNCDNTTKKQQPQPHQSQAYIVEEELRTRGYDDVLIRSVQQRDRDSLKMHIWVVVENNRYSIHYNKDNGALSGFPTNRKDSWLDRDLEFATTTTKTPANSPRNSLSRISALSTSFLGYADDIDIEEDTINNDSKKLGFSTVTIREHPVVLGDNVTVRGPPISLSWDYQDEKVYELEDYEQATKERRRSYSELKMPNSDRWKLLKANGYSRKDIQEASKLSTIARNQRQRTKDKLHLQPLHEALEKITRIGKKTIATKSII